MREIETDYLVVGAGASGMAFVDALLAAAPEVEVVIVDRRHAAGGHWLDAYPFVRLHQPSANYGVNSRTLGSDRIDASGANAGFYERATAAEVCDYFARVMDEFMASGRVRFYGMTNHRHHDEDHRLTSLLTGEETAVRVRRRVVDATYVESSIPSRHQPSFTVDPDVMLVAPNDLVDLAGPAAGFTILGAGKTAMDTCNWLLDSGVDADTIQWFRPRDPWLFDRAAMQPLDLVGAYMHMQACWVAAAADARDGCDFGHRLAADGVFVRIDDDIEPTAFRGATISQRELHQLRTIERVVRDAKVLNIGATQVRTDLGEVAAEPNRVYVDCTAAGVRPTEVRPVFAPGRITLEYVTIGIVPWSAATVAAVEARGDDDAEKNRLCPPVAFTGNVADIPRVAYAGMLGLLARGSDPDLAAWNEASRLNPSRGAAEHLDDPRVGAAFATIGTNIAAAMANLEQLAEAGSR